MGAALLIPAVRRRRRARPRRCPAGAGRSAPEAASSPLPGGADGDLGDQMQPLADLADLVDTHGTEAILAAVA
ncbi:hypothetical protein AB0E78_23810 [Streptomyces sp. NPDC032198]|uniref:hypothetical protein n=1 Tax=Streptomyces sp. NPDC032198 TaxID=3155127 RepID=UPI0033F0FE26